MVDIEWLVVESLSDEDDDDEDELDRLLLVRDLVRLRFRFEPL